MSLSLSKKHKEFLALVAGQGDGSITLNLVGNVAIIEISNPNKRNAICGKMMVELANIVDNIVPCDGVTSTLPDTVVGLVLKGCGTSAFSSGCDFALAKYVVNTPALGAQMVHFMTDALNRLRQCPLVSVCVINGLAVGGGMELTTTTDFRIMVNDTKFYIQSVHARIGASLAWGGARRITHIVGRKEAIKMCCACIPLTIEDAVRTGYVDELINLPASGECSEEQIIAAGIRFLQPYTSQPYAGSVRAIKTAIAVEEDNLPETAMKIELDMFEQRWYGPDNLDALSTK